MISAQETSFAPPRSERWLAVAAGRPLRVARGIAAADFRVAVVKTIPELKDHVRAWEDLAASALERNVFYEPWMLLPALEHLAPSPDQMFVLLFAKGIAHREGETLCGFFPLQTCRTETALSVEALGLLRHPFCYLRTPLLRAECAAGCLQAFFDWLLAAKADTPLFELGDIPGEGPFRQLLADELDRRSSLTFECCLRTRALFLPTRDADTYLHAALTSGHKRDFQRKERRLGEHGAVRYEELAPDSDIDAWIDEFLELEASGWKGQSGTAMKSSPATSAYFRDIVSEGFRRGRVLGLTLRVGERARAMRVSFVEAPGAMAFKIAYAEDLGKFSPGVLLELENIRRLHKMPEIEWMDCGARPDNPLFNHLWMHRRSIETLLVAGPGLLGSLVVSALPLGRWVSRALRRQGLISGGPVHTHKAGRPAPKSDPPGPP